MSDFERILQNKQRTRVLMAIDRVHNPDVKMLLAHNTHRNINLELLLDCKEICCPLVLKYKVTHFEFICDID